MLGAEYGCGVSHQKFQLFTASPLAAYGLLIKHCTRRYALSLLLLLLLVFRPIHPHSPPAIEAAKSTPTTPTLCPLDPQPRPGSSPTYQTLSRPPLPQHQHPLPQPLQLPRQASWPHSTKLCQPYLPRDSTPNKSVWPECKALKRAWSNRLPSGRKLGCRPKTWSRSKWARSMRR